MNESVALSVPVRKTAFIRTYGCQMNVYDSERMAEVLTQTGYTLSDRPDDADLVILNTCHIREKASEKMYSDLGRLRRLQTDKARGGGRMMLAVGGCVAQAEGAEISARAKYVDLVFGPQTVHRLPELLARAANGETPVEIAFPTEDKFDALPSRNAPAAPAAFLSIQEGCDRFCTFCVVPYTRGAESSRPVVAILEEARQLLALGAREITLLGQNVNAYHGGGPDGREWGLGRLIRTLAELEPLQRLRYTTSHPRNMDDDLIAAHGDVPQLAPWLHLPVQSGSDRILTAMNRRHSADEYRRVVDRLRHARPDLALSSDFIVGFPGETDQDFAATVRLIADVRYDGGAFSFKYSPRPGTPAASFGEQVPESVKDARLQGVQQLLTAQRDAFNVAMVGRVTSVLFEKPGRWPGQVSGRSPWMQPVFCDGPQTLIGQEISCRITGVTGQSLSATALDCAA